MKTAREVACYIIDKCTREEVPISNLQLQKILYYVQKVYLQSQGALFDDDFVAWQFGPVIEDVYYNYCSFGSMPIRRRYDTDISSNDKVLMDPIIEKKRELDPWEMVSETHKKNGAWDTTYLDGRGNGRIIAKDLISSKG